MTGQRAWRRLRLPGGWPAVTASTAVTAFLAVEGRLRQDAVARSLIPGDGDAGAALRLGSSAALGSSYTRTLRVRDAQRLVDSGVYARIRHPGYAGTLTMFIGYALAWQAPVAVLPALPLLPIYHRRITVEERLLGAELGDAYAAYRQHTDRLLPGIW